MNRIVRSAVFLLPLALAMAPIGALLVFTPGTQHQIVIAPSPTSSSESLHALEAEPGETVLVRFRGQTFTVHIDG
jgi:hypothetical protein